MATATNWAQAVCGLQNTVTLNNDGASTGTAVNYVVKNEGPDSVYIQQGYQLDPHEKVEFVADGSVAVIVGTLDIVAGSAIVSYIIWYTT